MFQVKAPALRSYQVKLNTPTEEFLFNSIEQRGQIYAPTGAGKTVCFNDLIRKAIEQGYTNIAIVHPRIALSQDQLKRFQTMFGNTVKTTSFHSGVHSTIAGTPQEYSTLDDSDVELAISNAKIANKAHVTFSSYHSFNKLTDIKFDLIICDEAHYLVQDSFSKLLESMSANKILFYTATPINEKAFFGDDEVTTAVMNNLKLFGKVIASVEPKELIQGGYIVAPLVHTLDCVTSTNNRVDIVDLVAKAYAYQYRDVVGKYGMPYAQMLVAARNVADDLEGAEGLSRRAIELQRRITEELGDIAPNEFINIYTISSLGVFKNGVPMGIDRQAALDEVKSSRTNAIIAHYDTLSEGIDIDTLTGVVLMRSLSKAKLIQTIGRCARPYIGDLDSSTFEPRKELFSLEANIDTRKKPRCIVTLPTINEQWIANSDGRAIAEAFIIGGYEDLATYMASDEDKADGGKKPVDPFLPDDSNTLQAEIESASVERDLEVLRELFNSKLFEVA